LIVNFVKALSEDDVYIFTTFFDKNHCFDELKKSKYKIEVFFK